LTEKAILNCPLQKVSIKFIESLRKFLGNISSLVHDLEGNDVKFRRNFNHFTQSQFDAFIGLVWQRYKRAIIQPGEACGAVAA